MQAASQEKDAYLFLLFVLLKSCVLHPFYCCLHSTAGRAQLCTELLLWLSGTHGGTRGAGGGICLGVDIAFPSA